MKRNDSRLFAVTRSVENIIVRTNWPCAVPNPVLMATPRQPPSGVLIGEISSLEVLAWRIFVPPNRT